MGRKTAKVALGDLAAKVDGRLPPLLAGPPSWAPVGYVCRPEDVTELLVSGHRRATAKDLSAFAAQWNRDRAERESAPPRPAPAPPPAASTRPAPVRRESPSDYVARCLAEPTPSLPADTPVAIFNPYD